MALQASDYRDAIRVQGAVNLSGVLRSAAEAQARIREGSPEAGTRAWNRHPIMVMYATAIVELAGAGLADTDAFAHAYETCRAECIEAGLDPDA